MPVVLGRRWEIGFHQASDGNTGHTGLQSNRNRCKERRTGTNGSEEGHEAAAGMAPGLGR